MAMGYAMAYCIIIHEIMVTLYVGKWREVVSSSVMVACNNSKLVEMNLRHFFIDMC